MIWGGRLNHGLALDLDSVSAQGAELCKPLGKAVPL